MGGSRLFFGTLMAVILSTTYVFVRESASGPRFEISNDAMQDIVVSATWREQDRDFGKVAPGSTKSLTIRDEASITFRVRYSDGRETDSAPIYFSSGITTHVSISEAGITIEQDAST